MAECVTLSREKKNKQKIVANISCFTDQKQFARAKNSPPGWEEGSTNLFLPNISCKSKPHAKVHNPGKNHSHPKQDEGKRQRERERKSTLIVDTIFRIPRLGAVHALHSDQIYLTIVMIFLFRYKLWFNFI